MRILEFLQDETNKFSSNRLISILFALTAVFISIFLTVNKTMDGEFNLLIGVLISGSIGNKFASNYKKGDKELNINTEK